MQKTKLTRMVSKRDPSELDFNAMFEEAMGLVSDLAVVLPTIHKDRHRFHQIEERMIVSGGISESELIFLRDLTQSLFN
jgi:hypothetical protein